MNHEAIFYPELSFGGFTDADGTICFYTRVNSLITPTSVLLDFGSGCGVYGDDPNRMRRELRIVRHKVARVIGVDVDQKARNNPFVDDFRMLTAGAPWPVTDSSIDIIISDSVMEHLSDPAHFFSECRRVLRPGGYLCIRTTNMLSYVGIASRFIPNRHHAKVLKVVQEDRNEESVFPTVYSCNTVHQIRKMMAKYGFDHSCYGHESEPHYLSFSKVAYALGVLYQKYSPGFLKTTIFAFGRLTKKS